jgi:hypothetical protein
MEQEPSKSREEKLLDTYNKLFEHLQQAPRSRVILIRLADTCLELGRREEALGFYKRAVNFGFPPEEIKQKLTSNFTKQELEEITFPVEVAPFWQKIGDLVTYPFSAEGILVILIGAVAYTIVTFALYVLGGALSALIDAPHLRIFSQRFMPICLLVVSLYVFSYMVKIVDATSKGDMKFPSWPEVADFWESIVSPGLLVVTAGAISFFFALIVIIFVSPSSIGGTLLLLICFFVGSPIFPMALLAGIKQDSFIACFNFPLMFGAIRRIMREYLFILIPLWGFGVVSALIYMLMRRLVFVLSIIGLSLFWGLGIYFTLLFGYILGNVFYLNRRELTDLEGVHKR